MFNILITIIISFVIIIILHYLFNMLKDSYSTKKTRDLVGSQTQKYKIIIDELLQNKTREISEEERQTLDDDLTMFMNIELGEESH